MTRQGDRQKDLPKLSPEKVRNLNTLNKLGICHIPNTAIGDATLFKKSKITQNYIQCAFLLSR